MKTIEEVRDHLQAESKMCKFARDAAVERKDWQDASDHDEVLFTYRYLLDWIDGKCE